ncbi:bifunctional folylpolyglutamate synthase/dihydrofolate synthase, partial [Candidatus Margulisiibacteriota bacterium]
NPQKAFNNIIHIAGTNGKGSTLTFLASALIHAGYKIGTFTSPHLIDYTERICVNFKPITKADFMKIYQQIAKLSGFDTLTEFEVLVVISIIYYSKTKLDFLIYETGLGGRLDATNIFKPILTIITKIDLEHQAILGESIEEIAKEKAGIIKPLVPCLAIKQKSDVLDIIQITAKKQKAPLFVVEPEKNIPANFKLNANYQKGNLALAKKALRLLLEEDSISVFAEVLETGLAKAQIPGRFQEICFDGKKIIIDAAHNPTAIIALIKALKNKGIQKPAFLVGILKTKNAKDMLKAVIPFASKIYYCDFEPGVSWDFKEIQNIFLNKNIVEYKLGQKLTLIKNSTIVVTGSIYFLGEFSKLPVIFPTIMVPLS